MRGIHRWPLVSPHKGPVTRKMFPFDDVIMDFDFLWMGLVFLRLIQNRFHFDGFWYIPWVMFDPSLGWFFNFPFIDIPLFVESFLTQVQRSLVCVYCSPSSILDTCGMRIWRPGTFVLLTWLNTWRQRQNCRHFADDIFKCIFLNENAEFRLRFNWSLLLRFELTISQNRLG